MYSFGTSRLVNAPKDIVWEVISDLNSYADYAPNLSRSVVLSGEGVGLIRRCTDTHGGEWNETCVLWEEGRQYSIQVDTSDYPYPFTHFQGTWELEERSDGRVLITMRFDYQPKFDPPLIGPLMQIALKHSARSIAGKLMDNWVAEIERRRFSKGERLKSA
jgi:ribosome-associated toxin RatA of RatAB toxin-antitoxin module